MRRAWELLVAHAERGRRRDKMYRMRRASLVAQPSVGRPGQRADAIFSPWIATIRDREPAPDRPTVGFTAGGMHAGAIGGEVDMAFRRTFDQPATNSAVTMMGNLIVGIPLGGESAWRAALRQWGRRVNSHSDRHAHGKRRRAKATWDFNLGGGLMGFVTDHFGLRGDVALLSGRSSRGTTQTIWGRSTWASISDRSISGAHPSASSSADLDPPHLLPGGSSSAVSSATTPCGGNDAGASARSGQQGEESRQVGDSDRRSGCPAFLHGRDRGTSRAGRRAEDRASREFRQRVARAPERFGRLPRAKLAAVPHHGWAARRALPRLQPLARRPRVRAPKADAAHRLPGPRRHRDEREKCSPARPYLAGCW